ncbi:MAG: hypothetical protein EOO29_03575 [Comamonadaceae bacterium]|nr:MAG: hypothetical protein EOO29_03575 [Comamonadaceae bacterium]
MIGAVVLTPTHPSSAARRAGVRAPLADLPDAAHWTAHWPFHSVALWDAPSRIAPALLLAALVGAWASGPLATLQTLHRALDMALPWLALFHLLWPLCGPRRAVVWARLRDVGWRESLCRWTPRALGPGRIALLMRLGVLGLLLGASLTAGRAPVWHHALAVAALGLTLAQLAGAAWLHRRSGDAWGPALLRGMGTGRPDEGLHSRSHGWAMALCMWVPACWAWQAVRAGASI